TPSSVQKCRSAPQKQPSANTACSSGSGNGGRMGRPCTKCRLSSAIGVSRPGRSRPGSTSSLLPLKNMAESLPWMMTNAPTARPPTLARTAPAGKARLEVAPNVIIEQASSLQSAALRRCGPSPDTLHGQAQVPPNRQRRRDRLPGDEVRPCQPGLLLRPRRELQLRRTFHHHFG